MTVYSIKAMKYCEQSVPGPQMFFMSNWGEWMKADFYFFILRSDEGKIILIDTGIRDVDEIQPLVVDGVGDRGRFRMDMTTQRIPLLLAEEGIEPSQVEHVLLSHLHYDHCSNVQLFPNAKFYVSRRGWHLTLDPPDVALVPDMLFPRDVIGYLAGEARDSLVLLDDEAPDILLGIDAFYVGGHTMCCQAFIVETRAGRAVFPSDTIFYYENLSANHPIGLAIDIKQCYEAMARVRALNGILVPPHDPELMRRYPDGMIARL